MESTELDKKRIFYSVLFPLILVVVLSMVKLIEWNFGLDFANYGVLPRTVEGVKGIFFAPFIHADATHLFNNSIPLLILGFSLFYFYKPIAWRVLFLSFLLTSLYTWISARYSYHIGASGVVYSLFSFLLISGFIRRHMQLIAMSFLVAFLYGSLIWGILPWDKEISWEGHFWGFFVGIILSIYYRKEGPQRKEYVWEEEELEQEDESRARGEWNSDASQILADYEYSLKKED